MPNAVVRPRFRGREELDALVECLERRGQLDRRALVAVLKDLADGKPLELVSLAAIFGVEPTRAIVRQLQLEGVL